MRTTGLAVLALLALFAVSGCTTATEYVARKPQCEPVVVPALPVLEKGEIWQTLGDSQYRELERYVNGLWGVIDEQAALIEAVCQ